MKNADGWNDRPWRARRTVWPKADGKRRGCACSCAMETAAGFIGENTLVLSVLNGVSSEEILAERFGETNILYCTAQGMDAVKVGNALTYAHAGMIVLGEKLPGEITPRVQAVADFLNGQTDAQCRSQPDCDGF